MGAQGQDGRKGPVQKNRPGNETTGAPEDLGNTGGNYGYGIVAAYQNVPVMNKESVRNAFQAADGLAVFYAYGFIRLIGAGHNEGRKLIFHDQVMQRGIGKHDPQIWRSGG